jgi:hypothetical protein
MEGAVPRGAAPRIAATMAGSALLFLCAIGAALVLDQARHRPACLPP